jgi:aminopeptidase
MNQVFLETLFDENAACHIALGDSFPECIKDGSSLDKDILFNEYHLNKCDSHVDFMIGTKDLNIIGITKDNKEIPVFINGNFSKEFE